MHPGSHCRGLSLLTYLCIHRLLHRVFGLQRGRQGCQSCCCWTRGYSGGRRRSNKRTGTPESLWPGFEGVVEDSHHHQQQPLGGGRRKGIATLEADPVWYLQPGLGGGGGHLFVHPIFDKIKLHQYFNILICLSLLGELRGFATKFKFISGHITHKGSSFGLGNWLFAVPSWIFGPKPVEG